jgi:phosphotransferase system HPr-like phosphotransfer protein
MVSEKILVGSALGIHLRPAGAMCDTAVKFVNSCLLWKYMDIIPDMKIYQGVNII